MDGICPFAISITVKCYQRSDAPGLGVEESHCLLPLYTVVSRDDPGLPLV